MMEWERQVEHGRVPECSETREKVNICEKSAKIIILGEEKVLFE